MRRLKNNTEQQTDIVSLEVKVGEVECNSVLGRGHDFPHAALVLGVQLGEGGAGEGAVESFNHPSARICNNSTQCHHLPIARGYNELNHSLCLFER